MNLILGRKREALRATIPKKVEIHEYLPMTRFKILVTIDGQISEKILRNQ